MFGGSTSSRMLGSAPEPVCKSASQTLTLPCRCAHRKQTSAMQQAKQWGLAGTVLLLSITCCCLIQPAAAQRRQLAQASWKSQFLSLAVTINGPCTAAGYPADIGITFAESARKDAERLANVVVARIVKSGVLDAGNGACLTRKVGPA